MEASGRTGSFDDGRGCRCDVDTDASPVLKVVRVVARPLLKAPAEINGVKAIDATPGSVVGNPARAKQIAIMLPARDIAFHSPLPGRLARVAAQAAER